MKHLLLLFTLTAFVLKEAFQEWEVISEAIETEEKASHLKSFQSKEG